MKNWFRRKAASDPDRWRSPSDLTDSDRTLYIEDLQDNVSLNRDARQYSIKRFDILIITVSSAAIGFGVAYMKMASDDAKNSAEIDLLDLQIGILLFLSAIICNLLSQVFAYFSSQTGTTAGEKVLHHQRYKIDFTDEDKASLERKHTVIYRLNVTIRVLGLISIIALFSGIGFGVAFYL